MKSIPTRHVSPVPPDPAVNNFQFDEKHMKRANERTGSSLRVFEPDPALVYSIEVVERLTQVSRRKILVYCRHHLVSPVADPELHGYCFSSDTIRALRWIGYLDGTHGVNLAGIKLILNLADEVQRLGARSAAQPPPTQPSKSMAKKRGFQGDENKSATGSIGNTMSHTFQ